MNAHAFDPRPFLDLNVWAWRQRHGDIEAFGSWCGRERRPCMVLVPARRPRGARYTPCIIRLENAFIYRLSDDEERDAAVDEVMAISMTLGLGTPDIVMSIILHHFLDLYRQAPKPEHTLRVVADARATDPRTGKTYHSEIVDDV